MIAKDGNDVCIYGFMMMCPLSKMEVWGAHGSFGEEKMRKLLFQLVTLVTGMSSSEQRLGLELSQWLTPMLSVVTPVAPNKVYML